MARFQGVLKSGRSDYSPTPGLRCKASGGFDPSAHPERAEHLRPGGRATETRTTRTTRLSRIKTARGLQPSRFGPGAATRCVASWPADDGFAALPAIQSGLHLAGGDLKAADLCCPFYGRVESCPPLTIPLELGYSTTPSIEKIQALSA
jgi:hypothetical protein